MKKTGPDEWGGGLGGSPPVSGRESENCFKNAWKCVKFQKIFACGDYRHRRRHQSFSIIRDKFFKFYGDEHKFCHFSRLRRKIFGTKIFYQNFSIPPWRQVLRPALEVEENIREKTFPLFSMTPHPQGRISSPPMDNWLLRPWQAVQRLIMSKPCIWKFCRCYKLQVLL